MQIYANKTWRGDETGSLTSVVLDWEALEAACWKVEAEIAAP